MIRARKHGARDRGEPAEVRPATLEHLGWLEICEALEGHLRTPMARARLERELAAIWEADSWGADLPREDVRVIERCTDVERARDRLVALDGIEALCEVEAAGASHGPSLATALAALEDLTPVLDGLHAGRVLAPAELWRVLTHLEAAGVVDALVEAARERPREDTRGLTVIEAMLGELRPLRALRATLAGAIAGDGPDGEPWVVDGASPKLAKARARARSLRRELARTAEKLLRVPEVAACLQDKFWTERDGRIVLPVRADARGHGAVAGIMHDSSASGSTVFVEPQALVSANNGLREAEVMARAAEREVLEALSREVVEVARPLRRNATLLVEVDVILARLRLGQSWAGIRPDVALVEEAGTIALPGARHPLMALAGAAVVANDITLEPGRALILSGPNAGGKTVTLKTVGLCALLAQAGFRLPTEAPATVPLFRRIVTDVGDDQSIQANLSTFTAHISHVLEAFACLAIDGPRTLVLLDEIAAGTDPVQGAALAEAIVRAMVAAGATVVTTTHYDRLKLLARELPEQFVNGAVGFDLERMAPTFRLTLGLPGASSAIAVARRLGLPDEVLADAEARVDDVLKIDVLLQELDTEREALAQERAALVAVQDAYAVREAALARREQGLVDKAKLKKIREHEVALSELQALRGEIARARKALKRADKDGVGAVRTTAERSSERLAALREPAAAPDGAPPPSLAAGDRVQVISFRTIGEVVDVRDDGQVVVQLGAVKTTVKREELRPLAEPEKPRKIRRGKGEPLHSWGPPDTAKLHFGGDPRPVAHGVDNSVDLRGERVDEALRRLDTFLGEALRRDRDVVVIHHGHGGGILRAAVREHLERQGFVRALRPGLTAEGGDAVTVAWLDP